MYQQAEIPTLLLFGAASTAHGMDAASLPSSRSWLLPESRRVAIAEILKTSLSQIKVAFID
jgi:hypothetical protein